MTDLDQSGHGFQRARTYLGPTLGWTDTPVQPSTDITTGGTYNVQSGDSILLVDVVAAQVTIRLPDLVKWIQQPTGQPQTGFDRSLTIKDIGGNAANFNILVVPFGEQTIDNIAQAIVISQARATLRLLPLIDMTGWAVDTATVSGGGGGGGGGDVFKAGNNTFTGINNFQHTIIAPTMGQADNSPNVATTAFVKIQGYLTSAALTPYALLFSPIFTGDPTAPTPPPGNNTKSIATTAFVHDALAAFTGGAPMDAEYITGSSVPALTNERVLVDSASITWDKSVAGQIKANSTAGGGNVSNSGTPVNGQLAEWLSPTVIRGIDKSSLGFAPIASPTFTGNPQSVTTPTNDNSISIATTAFVQANIQNRQPLDADLTAIAALTGTNTIYYRGGPDTWLPVGFSGLTFSGGILTASAGAPIDAEFVTTAANAVLTGERVIADSPSITWDKTTPGLIKANAVTATVPFHGFTATKSATQSIPNAIWTKVSWGATAYNNSGLFDTVNDRYVPVAGEVALVASVWADGLVPGSNIYLAIYKNGAILRFATANNTNGMVQVTCYDMSVGTDYYEVYVFGYTTGGSFSIANGNNDATYFQGQQPMGPPGPAGTVGVAGTPFSGQYAMFTGPNTITGTDPPAPPPSPFSTGDVKFTIKSTPDTGWVMMNDGSIGDATSGGTTRANADCQALFELLWNGTALGIQDSSGNTVVRGANSISDWNAHRRFPLPKTLGRALAASGTGSGLTGRSTGSSDGVETVTQSVAQLAAHNHGVSDPAHTHTASESSHSHPLTPVMPFQGAITLSMQSPDVTVAYCGQDQNVQSTGSGAGAIFVNGAFTGIGVQNNGSSTPMNVVGPRVYLNVMIKL